VTDYVVDASALLALLNDEPGAGLVRRLIKRSAIGAVNLSEVASKLGMKDVPYREVVDILDGLRLDVVPFDRDMAFRAARLRPLTRSAGLSLGDCACLALAAKLRATAVTADRNWTTIDVGIKVRTIR
jgi:PIN domain nuclease of toxin-antitoxin system